VRVEKDLLSYILRKTPISQHPQTEGEHRVTMFVDQDLDRGPVIAAVQQGLRITSRGYRRFRRSVAHTRRIHDVPDIFAGL
jgi:hypothetical protein